MNVTKLLIPETAKIKFKITDDNNYPVLRGSVNNWIYSSSIEDGFTDWINVLPTIREPYVAEVILPDGMIILSNPFLLFSGEQKIINIIIKNTILVNEIPSWIKNNAGWWVEGMIDDASFIQGIQFLIKEGIIQTS